MECKDVIEKQIEKLVKLQDKNVEQPLNNHTIENAVKIAEEIRLLCNDAKHII